MRDPETSTDYLGHLEAIGAEDAAGLKAAQKSYGNSWKSRGGVGAFMMLARKWDRLENRVKNPLPELDGSIAHEEPCTPAVERWDIFGHVQRDSRGEGLIDDVRDLRRYLMLVEAELRACGVVEACTHRDNKE